MSPLELAISNWNSQADEHNQWSELGQDEKDELVLLAAIELGHIS